MRKLVLLLLTVFVISLVSAANPCGNTHSFLDSFAKDSTISLYQQCENCTYVNVTSIKYPNGSIENINAQMTKVDVDYNYTSNRTQDFGCYSYTTKGDKNGVVRTEIVDYEVTPSGSLFTNALSLPVFLPLILMLLMMIICFIIGGFVEKKEYKLTFLIIGGIFMIFGVSYGIIASRDFLYGFPLLYGFVNSFYTIFVIALRVAAIVIPVMVVFFVIKRAFDTRGYNLKA